MRGLMAIVCSLLIEALANGQGFNKRYDAFGWGYAQTAWGVELLQDGYMVVSVSSDYDSIAHDEWFFHASVLLTRIDLNGNKLWEKRSWRPYHSAFPGWANCCDTIPGGGYVVGGASEDTTGFDEVYLMRFDAQGDTLWTKVFGDPEGNNFWIGQQVKRASDGGFVIVGFTEQGNWDGFALKTDSAGNELWRHTYGWSTIHSDGLGSIALAADGDLFMAGSRFIGGVNGDNWLQRTDPLGNVRWNTSWGGVYSEGPLNIATSSDGHVICAGGRGYAPAYAAMKPYVAKLDSADGSIIWEKEYQLILPSQIFYAVSECSDGAIISGGRAQGSYGLSGLLALTDLAGDSLWKYYYFYQDSLVSMGQGYFYDVIPTNDGGFISVGSVGNSAGVPLPPGYSQDTWVVKVDGNGCIVPGCNSTGITEQATNLLDALSIFPNPARGQATVRLTLPPSVAHLPLELSMVGMDGRLVHQQRITGNGEHQLALEGVSAGVYYIHIASEGKWLTGGKLVVE